MINGGAEILDGYGVALNPTIIIINFWSSKN